MGKGTWNSLGKATLTFQRKAPLPALTLRLTRSNDPATNQVLAFVTDGSVHSSNLTVTGGTFISECAADAAVWHPRLNPAEADEGKYTFYIDPGTGVGAPLGNGCGTLSVSKSGSGRFAGLLADGTKFSTSATLSKDSALSFYVTPYRKTGRFSGRIVLRDTPGVSDGDGAVTWSRLPNEKAKQFENGFETTGRMLASYYDRPARGTSPLTLEPVGEDVQMEVSSEEYGNRVGISFDEGYRDAYHPVYHWMIFAHYYQDGNYRGSSFPDTRISLANGRWVGRFPRPGSTDLFRNDQGYWTVFFQRTSAAKGFHLHGMRGGTVSFTLY